MHTQRHLHAGGPAGLVPVGVARKGAVIAVAAIILVLLWSPTSEGVRPIESDTLETVPAVASPASDSDAEDRWKAADLLTRYYSAWLSDAHSLTSVLTEGPLAPQF